MAGATGFHQTLSHGQGHYYSHMPWESYGRMTDDELKAIYKYLKTVKPVNTNTND
jgi:hypothetical protein